MSHLINYLETHQDTLVESALELLSCDTQNPPGHTQACVDWMGEQFDELDVEYTSYAVDPAKPNIVATIPGERDWTLLYNGHLDTVPFDEELWDYDPLGQRDGERIYGRGATDMKGALAAMLQTARVFSETGTTPPVTLQFAFVSDEEIGGEAGLSAVLESDLLSPDACVVGEATCTPDRHSITVADRGYIWVTLEAEGESAHGSRPMFGQNAIDLVYDALSTCRETLTNQQLSIDPAMESILEETVAFYTPDIGGDAANQLFETATVNVGRLEGGEAVNSVPPTATARLDIRLTASVHTPDVLEQIRDCIRGHEDVRITDVTWTNGTYTGVDTPIVDAVTTVAEDVTGERVYQRSATGGGDAQKLRSRGVPTVEFAPGTNTAHSEDEYTTTSALMRAAAVYTRLPGVLAEGLEETDE